MVVVALVFELLANKNILLVNGIAFTKSLGKCGNKMVELIVAINVCRILLYWVLHLQNG